MWIDRETYSSCLLFDRKVKYLKNCKFKDIEKINLFTILIFTIMKVLYGTYKNYSI